jgi:hypothetical protein
MIVAIYKDEESLQEFGNTVGKRETIEVITRQITETVNKY